MKFHSWKSEKQLYSKQIQRSDSISKKKKKKKE